MIQVGKKKKKKKKKKIGDFFLLGKKSDESLKLYIVYIVYVVVVIPFHAWMDVRTACLIRKALELPAQKYFESTHSPKDANSCQKPRPAKKQKKIF